MISNDSLAALSRMCKLELSTGPVKHQLEEAEKKRRSLEDDMKLILPTGVSGVAYRILLFPFFLTKLSRYRNRTARLKPRLDDLTAKWDELKTKLIKQVDELKGLRDGIDPEAEVSAAMARLGLTDSDLPKRFRRSGRRNSADAQWIGSWIYDHLSIIETLRRLPIVASERLPPPSFHRWEDLDLTLEDAIDKIEERSSGWAVAATGDHLTISRAEWRGGHTTMLNPDPAPDDPRTYYAFQMPVFRIAERLWHIQGYKPKR